MISTEITAENKSVIPALVSDRGNQVSWSFHGFFSARIQNKNTRLAHLHGVEGFTWLKLPASSLKQHQAVIRMLVDYLLIGNSIEISLALGVRGPKYFSKK